MQTMLPQKDNLLGNKTIAKLSLPLFMAGIFTNNPNRTFAADYFAFLTDRLYRWSYFHNSHLT